jgi:MFS family permease
MLGNPPEKILSPSVARSLEDDQAQRERVHLAEHRFLSVQHLLPPLPFVDETLKRPDEEARDDLRASSPSSASANTTELTVIHNPYRALRFRVTLLPFVDETLKRPDEEARKSSCASSPSSSANTTEPTVVRDPYRALRFRDFRLLIVGSFITAFGEQMLMVAIGWELYNRTGSALALGVVGLVQVLPVILLALPAGHVADQFNRKRIVLITQLILAMGSLGLATLSSTHGPLVLIYGCLFVMGAATAFGGPAGSALAAQTVPEEVFENAASWSSSSWQLAEVLGPALGGCIIALFHGAVLVYGLNAAIALIVVVLLVLLRTRQQTTTIREKTTLHSLIEGIRFLRQTQVLLAAITLDLFAVLLGGAVTLLPIFAKDILHVGPTGLGWLQAAPSIGAVCVATFLAHRPPFKKAGRTLLLAVACFGLATIVFGLSRSFWLSLLMLFLLGGFDNISVVIRSTLLLTQTPDRMRGRISAINSLFISTSNQLGGFESGLVAQLFSPIISVVGGGIGTILVVLVVALLWPQMRRLASLKKIECVQGSI